MGLFYSTGEEKKEQKSSDTGGSHTYDTINLTLSEHQLQENVNISCL